MRTFTARYDVELDMMWITNDYTVKVSNRFNALNVINMKPDEIWRILKEAVTQITEELIPKRAQKKGKPWLSEEAIEIAEERREVKASDEDIKHIRKLNGDFQRQTRKDKEQHIANICREMQRDDQQGRSRNMFNKIREISGKFTPRLELVKSREGTTIQDATAIKEIWKSYTEELHTRDKNMTEVFEKKEYVKEPSGMECKVQKALHSLKNNKSPGYDNIPAEMWKAAGDEGIWVITIICQEIWDTGQWPDDWGESLYIPILKKGNAKECANYRTIALISHASKVLLKVITSRLEQFVDRELSECQAGF